VPFGAIHVKNFVVKVSTIGEVVLELVISSNHGRCPHDGLFGRHLIIISCMMLSRLQGRYIFLSRTLATGNLDIGSSEHLFI